VGEPLKKRRSFGEGSSFDPTLGWAPLLRSGCSELFLILYTNHVGVAISISKNASGLGTRDTV
jgi:hypothetical protein